MQLSEPNRQRQLDADTCKYFERKILLIYHVRGPNNEESPEPSLFIQNYDAYKTPFCTNTALSGDNILLLRISNVGMLLILVRAKNL